MNGDPGRIRSEKPAGVPVWLEVSYATVTSAVILVLVLIGLLA